MFRIVQALILIISSSDALVGPEIKFKACPFAVAITNWRNNVNCGGSVLNSTSILTSAVCMIGSATYGLENYTVYIGSENLKKAKAYKIKKLYYFNFNKPNFKNDIVILELKEKINLLNIRPIKLPPNDQIPMNRPFSMCSFGNHPNKDPNKLRAVKNIQVMDNKKCREAYKGRDTWLNMMHDEIFCSKKEEKTFCYNDQGSALFIGNIIYGILYHGTGCSIEGNHALFLKVGKYLTAKKGATCYRRKQFWLCGNANVNVNLGG